MDIIGAVARVNTLSADALVRHINDFVLAPLLDGGGAANSSGGAADAAAAAAADISLGRRCFITWLFLYLGALLMYYAFAGLDYLVVFVLLRERLVGKQYRPNYREMRRETRMSTWSLGVMAVLTMPLEVLVQLGYSRVYHDAWRHGALYLVLSPLLFIVFSDSLIYFIHRGLHHRWVYKRLHKPHHSFIDTTPFSAFAFHPLDGFAQGVPYQLFVFVFPFHSTLHLASLTVVGMWTINIHDRVTLGIPGVNGAAHHKIHHLTFRSNYGQYFTVWDRMFGTHKDPRAWQKVSVRESDVYGDQAGGAKSGDHIDSDSGTRGGNAKSARDHGGVDRGERATDCTAGAGVKRRRPLAAHNSAARAVREPARRTAFTTCGNALHPRTR